MRIRMQRKPIPCRFPQEKIKLSGERGVLLQALALFFKSEEERVEEALLKRADADFRPVKVFLEFLAVFQRFPVPLKRTGIKRPVFHAPEHEFSIGGEIEVFAALKLSLPHERSGDRFSSAGRSVFSQERKGLVARPALQENIPEVLFLFEQEIERSGEIELAGNVGVGVLQKINDLRVVYLLSAGCLAGMFL